MTRTRVVNVMGRYEARFIALPLEDWKPGDPPERWPHGFVGARTKRGLRCGVWISDELRCARHAEHPIHHLGEGLLSGQVPSTTHMDTNK